jgi:hypothetical protein
VFSAEPEDAWRNAFITARRLYLANMPPLRKPPGPAATYGFFGGVPTTFTTIPKRAHQLEQTHRLLAPTRPMQTTETAKTDPFVCNGISGRSSTMSNSRVLNVVGPRVSSKNSIANRIETGERSGGIWKICSVEVEER